VPLSQHALCGETGERGSGVCVMRVHGVGVANIDVAKCKGKSN